MLNYRRLNEELQFTLAIEAHNSLYETKGSVLDCMLITEIYSVKVDKGQHLKVVSGGIASAVYFKNALEPIPGTTVIRVNQ